MNIQIFGKSKCFDTKKSERYFKERKVKYQLIDLPRYGMSEGELKSVLQSAGGLEELIDPKADPDAAALIRFLSDSVEKQKKLLEHPKLIRTPIVRNGKKATLGYRPDVWKSWD